jgi:hypothetical protein
VQGSSSFAAVGLVIVMTSACVRSRAHGGEAPVDVPIAPVSAVASGTSARIVATASGASSRTCEVQLSALAIWKSAPGCYLDVNITDGPGTLTYPCRGDGPATAVFGGKQRYTGKLEGGVVDLSLTTELEWEDGCRWATTATVRGTLLKDGKPARERLGWSYADRVIRGDSCSAECTARSAFEVSEPGSVH